MEKSKNEHSVEYSTPKFVEYGSAIELTKGSLISGLAEGTEPWTGWNPN